MLSEKHGKQELFCNISTLMDWKCFEEERRGNWTGFYNNNSLRGRAAVFPTFPTFPSFQLNWLNPGPTAWQLEHPFAGFNPEDKSLYQKMWPDSFSSATPALHLHCCLPKQHQHPMKLWSWLHGLPPHRALPNSSSSELHVLCLTSYFFFGEFSHLYNMSW